MKKRKRRGKLMWAYRDKKTWLYCCDPDRNSATRYACGAEFVHSLWPGPFLQPGEGPVRVRVIIERERSQRCP